MIRENDLKGNNISFRVSRRFELPEVKCMSFLYNRSIKCYIASMFFRHF